MQADAGKEEPFSAVALMNRSSDRWLLQQPMTSNSKPFPARRVTPTRLLSASAATNQLSPLRGREVSDDAGMATQVKCVRAIYRGVQLCPLSKILTLAFRRYSTLYFNRCPKHLTLECVVLRSRCCPRLPLFKRDHPRPQVPTSSHTPFLLRRERMQRWPTRPSLMTSATTLHHPGRVRPLSRDLNLNGDQGRTCWKGRVPPATRTSRVPAAPSLLPPWSPSTHTPSYTPVSFVALLHLTARRPPRCFPMFRPPALLKRRQRRLVRGDPAPHSGDLRRRR
jgi:hypothetical protein